MVVTRFGLCFVWCLDVHRRVGELQEYIGHMGRGMIDQYKPSPENALLNEKEYNNT